MRRAAANLLLLLATLAVCWLAADRAAAWLLARPKPVYPTTKFAAPRLIENSGGKRDYEYAPEKPPGVFRAIAVGDSFTQGGGVNFDDLYAKRLERYLNEYENVRRVRYQVLQWGRPGSSTPSQVALLREHAATFAPDLIVLGYCLNDAEDESDRGALQQLRRRTVLVGFEKGSGLLAWLTDRSPLVRLVRSRIYQTRRNRGHLDYYREIYAEDYPGWVKTRAAIADLGRYAREGGVPVVAMVFPLFSWDLDGTYPFRDVHARVAGEFEAAGIPVLDLLPVFRGIDHTVLEAVPFEDPHPSDVAHRMAAEELYTWLRDREMLPTGRPLARGLRNRRVPPPWAAPARRR